MPLCCYDAEREIKIDGATFAVNSPVQVSPFAVNFDISFIEMPCTEAVRLTPVLSQSFFHFRCVALDPAINGGVIDIHAAFGQHLLQLTIADAIFAVPAYRPQDYVTTEMSAFEYAHEYRRW